METHNAETITNERDSWRMPIVLGLGALVFVLFIAGFFSVRSLPGDMLYPTKVRITERLASIFTFGIAARMDDDVARLEMRLAELKMLGYDTSTSTPDGLASLAHAVNAQAERAVERIEGSSLLEAERIEALARLVHITKALETITDNTPEFAPIADEVERARETVDASLESLIETFATTNPPDVVGEFMSAHIKRVGEQLASVASGSDAQRRALARLNDTEDAIMDGDMERAVASILNAEEAIAVDGYLFDSERGPVDGAPALPTVPQEG